MMDQNNPGRAGNFSSNNSDALENDPLEELARIVSGDENSRTEAASQPEAPDQLASSNIDSEPVFEPPREPSQAEAPATSPADDGFDLEAELMQELGGFDDPAPEVAPVEAAQSVGADQYDPSEDAARMAAQRQNFVPQEPPADEAAAEAFDDFDLSEALENELVGGFEQEAGVVDDPVQSVDAAPIPVEPFVGETQFAEPDLQDEFPQEAFQQEAFEPELPEPVFAEPEVAGSGPRIEEPVIPTNAEGEPDWALQTSLEQELAGIEAEAGFEEEAFASEPGATNIAQQPIADAAGIEDPDPLEEFERALSEIPLDDGPAFAEPSSDPLVADELVSEPELAASQHEMDDLDLDFGAAFEAEVGQLQEAPAASEPIVEQQADAMASEADLEDEFAAAFADELDFGNELILDEQAQTGPDSGEEALWNAAEDEGAIDEFAAAATAGLAAAGAGVAAGVTTREPVSAEADFAQTTHDPYYDDASFEASLAEEVQQNDQFFEERSPQQQGFEAPAGYNDPVFDDPNLNYAPVSGADDALSADPMAGIEQELDIPPAPDSGSSDGRGFKVAAIALGVALFAGFGAVAYSFLSDSQTSEPVIIKADADPIKIKPEDPGGKVVANQDKAAYESVEGGDTTATDQERLVSSSEEPVNVGNNSEQETAALGTDKSDERLTPGTSLEVENTGGAVIAPRKVRTLTVKPDGTIVAAPAQPAPAASESEPVAGTDTGGSAPTEVAALETPSNAQETAETQVAAGPEPIGEARSTGALAIPEPSPLPKPRPAEVTFTPPSAAPSATPAPVAPAPRVAPAQPAPSGEDAPIQIASTPAPSAAPAATSAPSNAPWAVQISSQRSEAAARASYQNLRSRFSSVLSNQPVEVRQANVEGRGVFYRVRIPANSRDAANNLCNRLQAAGGSCFVTR